MGKIKDFFHRIGSDLDRVHVRAAFVDVEHRVAKLFQYHGEHFEKETPDGEE
ncbi:MAG: hypothetical protein IJ721_08230 [Bacteroidales bacterium]|nr:hypothetical protein [Bacteroidales bacterium]